MVMLEKLIKLFFNAGSRLIGATHLTEGLYINIKYPSYTRPRESFTYSKLRFFKLASLVFEIFCAA
jgi:hypothetical protein